jgi:hypothetical protein
LLIPVAINADSLLGAPVPGGFRYAVRLAAAVIDTAAQRVEHSDTTVQVIAPNALRAAQLSLHTQVSAAPTREAFFRLRVSNADRAAHTGTAERHIRVPTFAGDTAMLSDIVLGAAVEGGNFVRGGRRIALLPFAHSVDGRFRVFYELYNVPRATKYKTQMLVERNGGRAQDGTRLEFEDEGEPDQDGVIRVLRTLGTELRAGQYRITIRVLLPDNRYVEKSRVFIVGEV